MQGIEYFDVDGAGDVGMDGSSTLDQSASAATTNGSATADVNQTGQVSGIEGEGQDYTEPNIGGLVGKQVMLTSTSSQILMLKVILKSKVLSITLQMPAPRLQPTMPLLLQVWQTTSVLISTVQRCSHTLQSPAVVIWTLKVAHY